MASNNPVKITDSNSVPRRLINLITPPIGARIPIGSIGKMWGCLRSLVQLLITVFLSTVVWALASTGLQDVRHDGRNRPSIFMFEMYDDATLPEFVTLASAYMGIENSRGFGLSWVCPSTGFRTEAKHYFSSSMNAAESMEFLRGMYIWVPQIF